MDGNIERIINLKSERLSVNLSASKTFNKINPNVTNVRPRISTHHLTRKHHTHSHLSSSFHHRNKRSELRRFNQNRGNDDSEGEGAANCYTSSSEHSMDTVIFCGKSMRSSCNVDSNNQQNNQRNHQNNIPHSPNSSSEKPKVPIDGSVSVETVTATTTSTATSIVQISTITAAATTTTTATIEPRITTCQPMMMNKLSNLNIIQKQQTSSPIHYSSSSSATTTSTSPLLNHLSTDTQTNCISKLHHGHHHGHPHQSQQQQYKVKQSDKKVYIKKLVCDIGTSPLHKISLNCKSSNCPSNRNNCCITKGDQLWLDKPKKCKRKKPPRRISGVELWVDGPNAIPINTNTDTDSCDYVEKQQRISEWVNQHTKAVLSSKENSCCNQDKSTINHEAGDLIGTNPMLATSVTIKTTTSTATSKSSNGTNEMCPTSLTNPSSPYNVYKSTIKETNILIANQGDKLIETKEMACQTESDDKKANEKQIVDCKHNDTQELNTEETLILLSNLHDNRDDDAAVGQRDCYDEIDDWTDKRRLMLLERGALSDCCDNNQVCCCCSSSFTSEDDDVNDDKKDKGDGIVDDKGELTVTSEDKINGNPNNLDSVDVPSDLAEPPGQLKLEQFLKQLITVTNPISESANSNAKENVKRSNHYSHHQHHHRHRSHNGQGHRHHQHHPDDNRKQVNYPQYDSLPPRRLSRSRLYGSKYCDYGSHQDLSNFLVASDADTTVETVDFQLVNHIVDVDLPLTSDGKGHVALLPTSPRINRILGGTSKQNDQHGLDLTTNSPLKSSRKQNFNKRDTTSTTTSGHGTTSEGDDRSSVTKKSSDSSSSPSQHHHRTFHESSSPSACHHHGHHNHHTGQTASSASTGGPASSGYDSTIKDEESDRELVINESNNQSSKELMANSNKDNLNNNSINSGNNTNNLNSNDASVNSNDNNNDNGNGNGNTNQQGICNKSSVKLRDKLDKNRKNNRKDKEKEKDKRDSLSSEKCSFLCCKLTSFY